ncbi:MAG: protocatechuate 3,4-dioxygenase subunit alpha [Rhodospirillales bacterium]|nr:protocatechuate 3,4-dioxygenase subunit alpha [Rhodospirillales bacterium]
MQRQTPSQTIGPFFGFSLVPEQYGFAGTSIASGTMVTDDASGQRIRIVGRVFDGAGAVIPDALIEIWQADATGRCDGFTSKPPSGPSDAPFTGFGRVGTGARSDARFEFETVKPGSVDGLQAPHLQVTLFMRGLLRHVATRIYFADEHEANLRDPVLRAVPRGRRDTLIARCTDSHSSRTYSFDIHMQGERETVFFDV